MNPANAPSGGGARPEIRLTIPGLALMACALATVLGAWALLAGGGPTADGPAAASRGAALTPGMTDLSGKRSIFDDEPSGPKSAPPAAVPATVDPGGPKPSGVAAKAPFAVQVFQGDEKGARALEQKLRARGYEASLVPGEAGRTRVRVAYADRAAAEAGARRLEREERLPTWIVPAPAK